MRLIPINIETIRIGHPLPFPLMDKDGTLLAGKSFVIESLQDLIHISERGGGLYIDVTDSQEHLRAYLERLHNLVRDDKPLREIAQTKLDYERLVEREVPDSAHPDWLDLQVQANALLRDPVGTQFLERLERLHSQLSRHATRNPDGALFALIYLSATESALHHATQAMLVSVMCALAARDVLGWTVPVQNVLAKAALTMHLSTAAGHDRMERQADAPAIQAPGQEQIAAHRTQEILLSHGVSDITWLQAVRDYPSQGPGILSTKTLTQRVARVLQRADMCASRLAGRGEGAAVVPAAAMQACYFDESRQVDEAGAALIKALGIYPPGTFVRLATDEIAVVVKRGVNATTPRVAVLVNRSGVPTVEPAVRDTWLRDHRIVSSVAYREVKVTVNLERLLPLTTLPNSDRPW